jgi:hypothetical protein
MQLDILGEHIEPPMNNPYLCDLISQLIIIGEAFDIDIPAKLFSEITVFVIDTCDPL